MAIKAANAQTARVLLDQGADPNAFETPNRDVSLGRFLHDQLRGMDGAHSETPALALAVTGVRAPYEDKAGYAWGVAIVKALLDHGAHIDIKDARGVGIINLAVESNYDSQILRLLLQHRENITPHGGKDPSTLLNQESPVNGRTPLLSAAAWESPEEIDLLLRAGAKVDLPNDQGQTALMGAVEKGRPENIACLLKYHAGVRVKDRAGNTALSLARANRAGNVVTSFNHEVDDDFWPNIVKMLEKVLAQENVDDQADNKKGTMR